MDRFSLDRLPVIAAALFLAGKMQSGTPVDTQPQNDIHVDTQEAVYRALDGSGPDEMHEFSDVSELPTPFELFELGFTPPGDQFESPISPQAISSDDQPFLPSRRQKVRKPKREDWNAWAPPPPPLLTFGFLDDLFGRRRENIIFNTYTSEPPCPKIT